MSLIIGENRVVSLHYRLSDEQGKLLDSSDGADPLRYLHGAGNIIPGLEKALLGKAAGDTLQVRVEPAEGYGEILEELIHTVSRASFEGVDSVEVGMMFEAHNPDGATQRIVVKHIDGDDVTVDANHPLAGAVLHFDVEVVGVTDASEEEIAHGHVH